MSHHEWNDVMYGIELPSTTPSNDKILAFIDNHKEVFKWFTNENYYPIDHDSLNNFLDDYEDDCGNTGIGVLIADVIGETYIYSTHDQYGCEYVGIYAITLFPWNNMGDKWKSLTPERIKSKVEPVVEELYGECPEFQEYVIWNNG